MSSALTDFDGALFAVFATMSADSGLPPQQHKDIVQSFFQFDASREAVERFYGRPSAPQTPGNFSSQPPLPPMPNLPFGSEALQHLLPSMDLTGQQQGTSQSSQATPQALLEQQFRLNQLQQLQQLQNQIFQQQVGLMSSSPRCLGSELAYHRSRRSHVSY